MIEIVTDANELFSAIIAKGKGMQTKKLDILFSDKVKLYAPSKLFEELGKEKNALKLRRLSGFSESEFDLFIELLRLRIKLVFTKDFSDKLLEAKEICPHHKDIPYFALALKLNCPIWSGEKKFIKQSKVEIFNTKYLVDKFSL